MTAKFSKIKLRIAGFRELRLSDAVDRDLRRRAEKVARAAGPGWTVRRSPTRNRARYVVVPTTPEARRESITELAAVRALNAGGQ